MYDQDIGYRISWHAIRFSKARSGCNCNVRVFV